MELSPWNPSRRAIARVKSPLPWPSSCNCCGGPVECVRNSTIYGRDYGDWPWLFVCQSCRAYVGLHPFTGIPLGTLADGPTREARKKAKAAFNPLWEDGHMSRSNAYGWLAGRLGMVDMNQCHIGWFSVETCNEVIAVCEARLEIQNSF